MGYKIDYEEAIEKVKRLEADLERLREENQRYFNEWWEKGDTIRVPKESITQLREILATLKHWVTGNEGNKLINEAFEKHLGYTADGFKHFTPKTEG